MIPEQYWQLLRRWLWLIVGCVVVGGLAGLFVAPSYTGSTSSFTSNLTLAGSRYVSPSRVVTAGAANFDDDIVIADYVQSLADYAATSHFSSILQDALAEKDIHLSRGAIRDRVTITANPKLFRIEIDASGATKKEAETLAATTGDALIAKAVDDEDQVAKGLIETLDAQRAQLTKRLDVLETERRRLSEGARGRELSVVDLEIEAAGGQLRESTDQREQLLLIGSAGSPLARVHPPETVEISKDAMPARNLLLLGAVLGLVVGWVLANIAERLAPETRPVTLQRPAPRPASPEAAAAPAPARPAAETLAMNDRLRGMLARVGQLEERARALRDYTAGGQPSLRPGHEGG